MKFYIGCGMVLVHKDKFVLVQETLGAAKQGLFNLPGGTLEINEDIMQCVIREIREETGLSIQPTGYLGIHQLVMAQSYDNVLFNMFVGVAPDDAVFHSDEHEVIQSFSYDEIVELDKAGKLRAPTIMNAIDAYKQGKIYDLSIIHPYHIDTLASVTVDKYTSANSATRTPRTITSDRYGY